MSTIICKKEKNWICVYADKQLTWWYSCLAEWDKIVMLDNTISQENVIMWAVWNYVNIWLLKWFYEKYIIENRGMINTFDKICAYEFYNLLRSNWILDQDTSLVIVSKTIQVIIHNWTMEDIQGDVAIWSWSQFALSLMKAWIDIDKVFKITSNLDIYTWKEYTKLIIKN